MAASALWSVLLLPAATAALLLLGGRRLDAAAGPLGILQAAVGCVLSGWAWTAGPSASVAWLALPSRDLALSLSAAGPTGALGFTVAAVVLAVTVYAHGFLDLDEARARFFGFFALFAAGMQAVVLAGDLMLLLFGWEVVGACSFALIAFWHRETERVAAARRAFVVTRSADLGLYLALMVALGAGGVVALDALPELPPAWASLAVAGLILAAAGKSAQLPFSGWLRGAMEGPTPVSALLHSATMVAAGVVLLIKVAPLLEAVAWAGPLVLAVGVATALIGALIALAETDIKRVLAASTVSQHGYMVAAVGAAGTAAAATYLANHAAFKALLFMTAGVLVAQHLKTLPAPSGLRRALPWAGLLFLVGTLGLAALPPTGGFLAKEAVTAVVKEATVAGWLILLGISVLTAAYATRLYLLAFHGEGGTSEPGLQDARGAVLWPSLVMAVAVVLLALLLLPPVEHWWSAALAAGELPAKHTLGLVASLAAVVAGTAAGWFLWRHGRLLARRAPGAEAASRWFGLEAGLDAAGEAVVGLGRLLDRIDRHALQEALGTAAVKLGRVLDLVDRDSAPEWLGALVRRASDATRSAALGDWVAATPALSAKGLAVAAIRADRAVLDGAIRQLNRGLEAGAGTLSRLQGGMLHRYYAQTVMGMAVLLVAGGLLFRV